jgi:hypothetical protein
MLILTLTITFEPSQVRATHQGSHWNRDATRDGIEHQLSELLKRALADGLCNLMLIWLKAAKLMIQCLSRCASSAWRPL